MKDSQLLSVREGGNPEYFCIIIMILEENHMAPVLVIKLTFFMSFGTSK